MKATDDPRFSQVEEAWAKWKLEQVEKAADAKQKRTLLKEIVELIAPQGRLALINNEALELALLMRKCVSIHWESMFTRSMLETADMAEQHALLDKVAELVDAGKIRTTVAEHFGTINAANLKRAHVLLETGKARGKIVLEGFP